MVQDKVVEPVCPFEGAEKLLEIWFAPSQADVGSAQDGKLGLRKVRRSVWQGMLDTVKCKILSVIEGDDIDAYLLSESSLLIAPHRLILKTCGTTLNLLGVPRILEIARDEAGFPSAHRCFYSRRSFMFPERQGGPHREWKNEIEYLDGIFSDGAAYTVGNVNADHWLLYITGAAQSRPARVLSSQQSSERRRERDGHNGKRDVPPPDYTIEILMSDLSADARAPFFSSPDPNAHGYCPRDAGLASSAVLGIADIFPAPLTTLDAYSFTPCGYSSNAIIRCDTMATAGNGTRGEGYYTIHVTPEEGWSYASFECNVPLPTRSSCSPNAIPDLTTLIRRVVNIFRPGRLTLTLFISKEDNANSEEGEGESAIETAQKAFRKALVNLPPLGSWSPSENVGATVGKSYRRTDKINYEFADYDLAFASFRLCS